MVVGACERHLLAWFIEEIDVLKPRGAFVSWKMAAADPPLLIRMQTVRISFAMGVAAMDIACFQSSRRQCINQR